jgi:hypothetical protein
MIINFIVDFQKEMKHKNIKNKIPIFYTNITKNIKNKIPKPINENNLYM